MLTYMEGAEFNIGVDNLWALISAHHAQLNLKRNDGYPLLQCENPCPPHTSLFPDYLFQGLVLTAWSQETGGRFSQPQAFLWFQLSCVSEIFPYGSFPVPHVTVSFHTKLQRDEKPWPHTSHPENEVAQLWVSARTFLNLTLHCQKKKSSIRRKHHCRDLLGTRYIWNKWLSFPSPTLL